MVDDPQIGEQRRCIDHSAGSASEDNLGTFKSSGARDFDLLGNVF